MNKQICSFLIAATIVMGPTITKAQPFILQPEGPVSVSQNLDLVTITNIAASIGGATNGILKLDGFGTNTTIINATISSGVINGTHLGNANGVTNLPSLLGQKGRVIYVDSATGNDTLGNGTQEKPFKTIGYQFTEIDDDPPLFVKGGALGIAQSGDTIFVQPGTYTNEVIQLWTTNKNIQGISLKGSGRSVTKIYCTGSLSGGSAGMNIIQLGNGSVVSDLSFPKNTFTGNKWYNPIGNAPETYFAQTLAVDVYFGGIIPNDLNVIGRCTNTIVYNCDFWGNYDAVFFSGDSDYSAYFDNCTFSGRWDLMAVYGHNTNTVNLTDCNNCTFNTEGGGDGINGNVIHSTDCHGGIHIFRNCFLVAKNGGNRTTFTAGGTYGIYAEDGFPANGQTNIIKLFSVSIDVSTTNTGPISITNFSSSVGKSIVQVFAANMDESIATNWQGFCYNTNTSTLTIRNTSGSMSVGNTGSGFFDGAMVFARSAGAGKVSIDAGGNVSGSGFFLGGGTIQDSQGGDIFSLGATSYFDGGAIASDGSGNLTALSFKALTGGIASGNNVAATSTAITFPNTTVNWTNTQAFNIVLYIDNSGVTGTATKKNGQQVFSSLVGDVTMALKPGDYFSETYTVGTPSARWEPQ